MLCEAVSESRNVLRPEAYSALVLNADYKPMGFYPLKVLPWKKSLSSVLEGRVHLVEEHPVQVKSAGGAKFTLPSVVALKDYRDQNKPMSFTRIGVYLRDRFRCAYCGDKFVMKELTFDHVIPSSKGGKTTWTNIVTACHQCNLRKGDKSTQEAKMPLLFKPYAPSRAKMNDLAREFPPSPSRLHKAWLPYLGINPDKASAVETSLTGLAFPNGMTEEDYWTVELDE